MIVSPQIDDDGLPDRPYCKKSEAVRFVSAMTGWSKGKAYKKIREGNIPTTNVAGDDVCNTRKLREMFG